MLYSKQLRSSTSVVYQKSSTYGSAFRSKLPLELIYHILLYTGIVKYRNGKYIDQIPKTDERYKLVDSIPRHRVFYIANKYIMYVMLKIVNGCKSISMKFDFENNKIEYAYSCLLHTDCKRYVEYTCSIYLDP
jgi:hypothetical protein